MVHVMIENQNIILTKMIKSNALNVLRIALGIWICEKCISGLFGDTCEEAYSENCVNKRCDKNTEKCECINFYSEEINCSEWENVFD